MTALVQDVYVDGVKYAAGTDHSAMPTSVVDLIRNPAAWVGGTAPALSAPRIGKSRLTGVDLTTAERARTALGLSASATRDGLVLDVRDFGAVGDGSKDDTAAIQAAVTAATTNTVATFGKTVLLPPGRYKVSSTITSDLGRGVTIAGAGRNATYVLPTAAMVNTPVFKLIDYYHYTIRDMTIQGGGAGTQPSAAINSHRERANGSQPGQVCQKLHVTDVTMVNVQRGAHWTISGAPADGNNDQATVSGCYVGPFTVAAYDINGVNPVWHRFIGGEIASGPIAWRLAGGSFTALGTVIGNLSDVEVDVTAGSYIHPTELIGVSSENDTSGATILRTAAVANFVIKYTNYERTQSVINKTMIDFNATTRSQFTMMNSFTDLGQLGQLAQFTDSTSIARFIGNSGLAFNTISYNGRLILWGNQHIPGTVTLTNLGSGQLNQAGDAGGGFNPAPMATESMTTAAPSTNQTLNFALTPSVRWTLGASISLTSITNPRPGGVLTVILAQDATGSRTLSWPSNVKWAGGAAPTLSTAAGAVDVFRFVYDGGNWREFGRALATA